MVMLRKTTRYWRIFREGARRALSHKRDVFNLFRLCYRISDKTSITLFTAVWFHSTASRQKLWASLMEGRRPLPCDRGLNKNCKQVRSFRLVWKENTTGSRFCFIIQGKEKEENFICKGRLVLCCVERIIDDTRITFFKRCSTISSTRPCCKLYNARIEKGVRYFKIGGPKCTSTSFNHPAGMFS